MKLNRLHIFTILPALIWALLLSSCSNEPEVRYAPEGENVKVGMRISAETRAGGGYTAAEDHELINSWWIIFTEIDSEGAPGKVVKVISRPAANTGAVTEETVETELAPADYFVFAFANMTAGELEAATGFSAMPAEGSSLTGLVRTGEQWNATWNDIAAKVEALNNELSSPTKTALVPMSGMRRLHVTSRVNQTYSIEVVRMVSKLRFEFTNDTESDITVKSVTIRPYLSGGAYNLFPQYDSEWNFIENKVLLNSAFTPGMEEMTVSTGTMNVKSGTATATEATSVTRYVREMLSASNLPSGLFHLAIKIVRNGGGEETLYGFMTDEFNYINRNDYVIVPIRFSDWVIDFEVRYYPPIGGYPAKVVDNDEAEFTVRLGGSGTFEIAPKVGRYKSGVITWLDAKDFEYEAETVDASILDEEVTKNAAGEMVGSIASGKTGSAYIKFRLTKATLGGTVFTQNLPEKKIFILR